MFLQFASIFLNRALQTVRYVAEMRFCAGDVKDPNGIFDAVRNGDLATIKKHLLVDPSRVNLDETFSDQKRRADAPLGSR